MELFTLFLLFVIAVIGFTHIMVDSSIMGWLFRKPVEKYLPSIFGEMANCYQCMGTWCGWAIGILIMILLHKISIEPINLSVYVIAAFLCGFAGSFLAQIGAYIISWLEAGAIIDMKDKE